MKLIALTLLGLLINSSTAFAGSDTISCTTRTGSVKFDVGNGSNTISIKMKNRKSGKITTYTAPAKLMPYMDYNTEETDKTLSILPTSAMKMIRSNNQVQVVKGKNGKVKCSGRELTDETYSQNVIVTAKTNGLENQGLDYQLLQDNIVPGSMSDSGYLSLSVTCQHDAASTSGGCYADEEDSIDVVPAK
jgi:hypothetical protein